MAMPSLSVKKHRDRKNPATREFETKRRKETNAARPSQIRTEEKDCTGLVIRIIGPFRD